MTTPDTKRLREMMAKATPGEWKFGDGEVIGPENGPYERGFRNYPTIIPDGDPADLELIAALHNAAPALLNAADELDRIVAAFDTAKYALTDIVDQLCKTKALADRTLAAEQRAREAEAQLAAVTRLVHGLDVTLRIGASEGPVYCDKPECVKTAALELVTQLRDALKGGK